MSAEFPSTLSVRLSRRWDVVTVVVVLAAAAIRLPRRWTVLGDNALMLMWTDAVGTRHTPMVGGDARFGFDHAGPWLFYVLAIPYRILGSSAVGLLVGASVINLVCLVVIIRCVREVAGELAAASMVAGALLFLLTAPGDRLIDPWNPFMVQLPFLLALVACWALLDRRWHWLPWLVGAGSFAVQGHITFLVPVVVLGALALVVLVRSPRTGRRRPAQIALLVAVLAWLPPAIDMVLPGGHNLFHVARFFVGSSPDRSNGLTKGVEVVLRETGAGASWLGGSGVLDSVSKAFTGSVGLLPGIGVVMLLVAGIAAWRRRDRVVGSLVVILGALLPAAVVEMAAGRGPLFPYLFGWVTLVGLLCWLAGLLTVFPRRPPVLLGWLSGASVVALATVLFAAGLHAPLPMSPLELSADGAIVRRLLAGTESHLSRSTSYRLMHGADRHDSIYELGVVAALRQDGYRVVSDRSLEVLFGRHMTDAHDQRYEQLRIVAPYDVVVPGSQVVASSDPLDAADRAEEIRLVDTLTSAYLRASRPDLADLIWGADGADVALAGFVHPDPSLDPLLKRLAELRSRGRSVAVELHSAT